MNNHQPFTLHTEKLLQKLKKSGGHCHCKRLNISLFIFDKSHSQEINVRNSLMIIRQSHQAPAFPFKYHVFLRMFRKWGYLYVPGHCFSDFIDNHMYTYTHTKI